MKSSDYRRVVEALANSVIRKKLPGIKVQVRKEIVKQIAVAVHARMYGADVDGVTSPLYYDIYPDRMPTVSSIELAEQYQITDEK